MTKRILTFVMALVLILGLLPVSAFALTRLTFVGITGLDAPVAGATPDYTAGCNESVYLDAGNNSSVYYLNGICWYDMTDNKLISTATAFQEGHQYKAKLFINASDGFFFDENVSVTVNNVDSTGFDWYHDQLITVEAVFEPIPSVTPIQSMLFYTDHTPKAGNPLETVTLTQMNGTGDFFGMIKEWDSNWYANDTKTDNIGDYEPFHGSVYTAGTAFAYQVTATLKDGFSFSNQTNCTLNVTSKSYTVQPSEVSADEKTAVFYFYLDVITASPISSVAYTLNGFELGKPISGITLSSTSPVLTNEGYGSDYFITVGNRIPVMSGNFAADTTYTLYVAVRSNTHIVSGLTKNDIKVNGKTVTNTETVGGVLYAIYYLPKLSAPLVEINNVMLKMPKVASGALVYPTVYSVNGNTGLTAAVKTPTVGDTLCWYEGDFFLVDGNYLKMDASGQFKNQKAYRLYCVLEAAAGYAFAQNCTVEIQTPEGLVIGELYDRNNTHIAYDFYFNLGAPTEKPLAENVKVSLKGYSAGKPYTGIKVINTINGVEVPYINEMGPEFPEYGMFYAILDEEDNLMTEGNFEYGKNYTLSVLIFKDRFNLEQLEKEDVTLAGRATDDLVKLPKFFGAAFKLPQLQQPISNPFTDVKPNAYYYNSVLWAVQNGITTGTTPTTFSPNSICTRAQVVSFLWRANGCPEPTGNHNPFTDVKSNQYYYKAVLWAVEKGITTGVSATSFAPNANCTRGQIVCFLWRDQGSPKVTANNPFTDVKSKQYYYDAVLWAVQKSITNGMTPTTFEPNSNCTRGQIVCFLDRCLNMG